MSSCGSRRSTSVDRSTGRHSACRQGRPGERVFENLTVLRCTLPSADRSPTVGLLDVAVAPLDLAAELARSAAAWSSRLPARSAKHGTSAIRPTSAAIREAAHTPTSP
jgi:hypothetical protein